MRKTAFGLQFLKKVVPQLSKGPFMPHWQRPQRSFSHGINLKNMLSQMFSPGLTYMRPCFTHGIPRKKAVDVASVVIADLALRLHVPA